MNAIVLLAAVVGLPQTYSCEAGSPDMVFTDSNHEIYKIAPQNPPLHSSFEISVSDHSISVIRIEEKSVSDDFKPFIKITDGTYAKYFSEKSSFSLTGTAEPTVLAVVFEKDGTIVMIKSSPIAVSVNGGPSNSQGKYLPSIVTRAAFCSVEKNTR